MARQLAHINPAMLVWARKKSGREPAHVAAAVKVSLEKYLSWESGEELPSLSKMRAVARLMKRPLALFFLHEPPKGFSPIHDFRTLPGVAAMRKSPELLLAIRRAEFRRSVALELAAELESNIVEPDLQVPARDLTAPEFAVHVRAWLGISTAQQRTWRTRYEAKQAWQDSIESKGILVFQAEGVLTDEMRGFCISERPLPVIVTNAADTPNARIFTMMHELCHVLHSQAGICNPATVDPTNTGEVYCNRAAGEILVPPADLAALASRAGPEAWTDEELRYLSNQFSVSREVVVRRLLDMGRTTPDFYQNCRERFNQEYLANKRRRRQERDEFGRDMAVMAKSNNGLSYVRLVLSAMRTDLISIRDASDYLGIKSKHFDRLEEMAWQ